MTRARLALALGVALSCGAAAARPLGAPIRSPRPPPGPPQVPVFRPPPPEPAPAVRAPSDSGDQPPLRLTQPAVAVPADQGLRSTRPPAQPDDPLVPARAPAEGTEPPAAPPPLRLADPVPPPAPPQHPLAPPANSPEARARVRVTIRAIAARRSGEALEIDGRLGPIDRDLRSFAEQFNYKLYQLLDEQTLELDFSKPAQMELPGQRTVQVQATGLVDQGRLRLHLELLGPQPQRARKLHTDYSLPKGRTILVGGYQVDPDKAGSGTLLLAITQAE